MSKTPLIGVALSLLIAVGGLGAAEAAPAQVGTFNEAVAAGDSGRSAMDFTAAGSKSADLPLDAVAGEASAPLPLSQLTGGANSPPGRGPFNLWDLINQIRYGGLPEPASWTLMLVGFGMIGGALRGFMVANRRLAGLQPEQSEGAEGAADSVGDE